MLSGDTTSLARREGCNLSRSEVGVAVDAKLATIALKFGSLATETLHVLLAKHVGFLVRTDDLKVLQAKPSVPRWMSQLSQPEAKARGMQKRKTNQDQVKHQSRSC